MEKLQVDASALGSAGGSFRGVSRGLESVAETVEGYWRRGADGVGHRGFQGAVDDFMAALRGQHGVVCEGVEGLGGFVGGAGQAYVEVDRGVAEFLAVHSVEPQ